MATENTISQQLLDFLATRDFQPEMLDKMGKPTNAENAKTFTFDYVSGTGKNYGTMVIVLDVDNDCKIMYGDNLGKTMEGNDKNEFFDFIGHLGQVAMRNRWTKTIQDISQLKFTMQGLAAIKEGLFEGYYGTRKVSYSGQPTEARLQIVHNRALGEGDARHRYVEKLFIETADGERFRLGFKSLMAGRAMLEHVRQGGKPYDIRGNHITETVNEIAVLSRFNRASGSHILEGATQELITEAQAYYHSLRENLKHMGTSRGYTDYFESWHPATIAEQDGMVDQIKTLFIEQTIDSRIEAALPLLAKIQQRGQEMKEADIFESWINNLAEGTWSLPETPEQLDKLKTLMSKELVVGPDATNATEQLYDLVGDDILFDRLGDLAARDPRANAWNDTEVMQRLKELGIQTPSTPEPDAGMEPVNTEPAATPGAEPPVPPVTEGDDTVAGAATDLSNAIDADPEIMKGVEGLDGLAESDELNSILKYAGVPVKESVLTDSTGSTLDHICNRFGKEVRDFEESGDMSEDLYHALYDYYFDDMPYGTKKARDGDPYEWIADRFAQDRGLDEGWKGAIAGGLAGGALGSVVPALGTLAGAAAGAYAGHKLGDEGFKDPDAEYKKAQKLKQTPPVAEGSCNMTAEGQYCPEHGLMECGMGMAEDIMGEQDPMDSRGAVTDSYYESKDGTALLARIKSLALLK
jgi:hypothetical protein